MLLEIELIRLQDSERRSTFVTAQDSHAPHPNPLPEGEGAIGRFATLDSNVKSPETSSFLLTLLPAQTLPYSPPYGH
jgi:hypothetical protein